MSETNIQPFLGFPYENYLSNSRYPLSNANKYFGKNLKMIDDRNPEYTVVLTYIMFRMTGSKELLDALTFEFPKDWYEGRFRRARASKILKEMCLYNMLIKITANKQDWSYYVNPILFNTLTGAQCNQMYHEYPHWFR